MIASKSIRRIWTLGFEIVICIMIGVIASNALAAQATLAWNPNTESDLAGYRIHHGTASGSYTVHTDVHNVTSYTVTGLTAGQTYYFAATAYDASGNESGYSNPVSYSVPTANGAPTTPATPTGASSALVNTAITFSTSATDPNGNSLLYRYDWGGGVLSAWGTASQSHDWAAAGQYAVKAQARDSLGLESAWSGAKTVAISQSPQNKAPTANAGSDQTVNAGTAVALQGSGSDADDGIAAYQWRQISGATVALTGAQTQQASFSAPNSAAGGTALVFELKVTDRGGLSATDTATVTVQSASQPSTYRLWDNSTVPSAFSSETTAQELGMKFRTSVNGTIAGVRFYKGSADTGQHVGSLWSRSGQLLASVVFTNETTSGWQEARFATPVAIAANTTYVISYHTNVGRHGYTRNYFTSPGTNASPVRALADSEDGGNGVYRYGSTSGFPSSSYLGTNYWVDVVFQTTQTTTPPPTSTTYRLWDNSAVPSAFSSETAAQELGMKFRTSVNGTMAGVRFYKGSADTGQHVGNLWSRSGQLLASVVFTNETTSGWQEARFATPVAIAANTTYVISYHTNMGRNAYTRNYFTSPGTNASPVRALADKEDGGNGVYRYGSTSGFPSSTYLSTNYWVDVVFQTAGTTQAAAASAGTSAGTLAASAPATGATAGASVSAAPTTATTAAAPTLGTALPSGSTGTGTSTTEVPSASTGIQATKQTPVAPVPVSPVKDEIVTVQPVLKTGAFQHPTAGESHAETHWQVFRDDDSTCVLDIQTGYRLTSLTVPKLVLEEGAAYFWRAQFVDRDGDVSEWSDYGYFSTKTTDADLNANGIPDLQEVGRTADLDKDGARDSRQPDIKSIKMQGTGLQVGVSIKGCPTALAIEAVESEDPQQPGSVASSKPGSMPFGLINFRIAVAKPGDPAVVKLYFPQAAPASSKWYKYDPIAGRWYDFSAYAKFAADRFSVTLTLTDGGPGDADGVANGVIVDPAGIVEVEDEIVSGGEKPQPHPHRRQWRQ